MDLILDFLLNCLLQYSIMLTHFKNSVITILEFQSRHWITLIFPKQLLFIFRGSITFVIPSTNSFTTGDTFIDFQSVLNRSLIIG